MKKIILMFLCLIAFSMAIKAQCALPYKSLDKFNGDTTAFMVYNFNERADCYKNKKIADIKKDFPFPVTSITPIFARRSNNFEGIILCYNTKGEDMKYLKIIWKELILPKTDEHATLVKDTEDIYDPNVASIIDNKTITHVNFYEPNYKPVKLRSNQINNSRNQIEVTQLPDSLSHYLETNFVLEE